MDFHVLVQYKSHTWTTLNSLESRLAAFYGQAAVFIEFRASAKAREDADIAVCASMSTMDQDSDSVAPARKRRGGRPRSLDPASRELRVSLLITMSHFNFIKYHILRHYRSYIERLELFLSAQPRWAKGRTRIR